MTDLAFLLDAPATAATASSPIDRSTVDEWQRKLNSVFGGRVAIDLDHGADRGGSTPGAGVSSAARLSIRARGKPVARAELFATEVRPVRFLP